MRPPSPAKTSASHAAPLTTAAAPSSLAARAAWLLRVAAVGRSRAHAVALRIVQPRSVATMAAAARAATAAPPMRARRAGFASAFRTARIARVAATAAVVSAATATARAPVASSATARQACALRHARLPRAKSSASIAMIPPERATAAAVSSRAARAMRPTPAAAAARRTSAVAHRRRAPRKRDLRRHRRRLRCDARLRHVSWNRAVRRDQHLRLRARLRRGGVRPRRLRRIVWCVRRCAGRDLR